MGCGRSKRTAPEPSGGEVLLLGCAGAGKTLLCRQLERLCSGAGPEGCNTSTVPSIGTELLTLHQKRRATTLREVGGAMLPVWPKFYENCHSVAFVADVSDAAVSGALVEWYNLMGEAQLREKPLMLIFNKIDDKGALSVPARRQLFRLADCEANAAFTERVTVLSTCARTGEGVQPVLEWMLSARPTPAEAK